MILRKLFLIFLLSSFYTVFGFTKFPSEQKFYDEELELQFSEARRLVEDFRFDEDLLNKINNGLSLSEQKGNEYYENSFNTLLFMYYQLIGDMDNCYKIFEKQISKTHVLSSVSYVMLLDEFFDFFNFITYDEYTSRILNRIKYISEHQRGDEQKFIQSIIYFKESLTYKKQNIKVSRDALFKSIELFEEVGDNLTRKDYNQIMAKKYNYLSMTYLDFIDFNYKNDENINKINHAISVLKKSMRYNEKVSAYSSYVVFINLGYIHNVLGDYEKSLEYTKMADQLISRSKQYLNIKTKLYCNYTDSYNLKNDAENLQKYYPLCVEGLGKYEKNDIKLMNIISKNPVVIEPSVKFLSKRNKNIYGLLIITFISIVIGLYFFNRKLGRNK